MGLRIKTNVAALQAQRQLGNNTAATQQNMERLSSGYRINKSADDAAGLAISETQNAKIRSMDQAKRNANDGISMIQVAEGSMNEITNILVRMRELSTQAASDTLGNKERSYTNKEYKELANEIDRISNTSEFNGMNLLGGEEKNGLSNLSIHVGAGDGKIENTDTITIEMKNMKLDTETLGIGQGAEIGPEESDGAFTREQAADKLTMLDKALETVANNRAYIGSKQSRLNSTINNLGIQIENTSTAKSRIKDVDFATESASFAQNKILQQAGTAVLAQAGSTPDLALQLLRG